jgi:predicted amidophosphoribosyltransferase
MPTVRDLTAGYTNVLLRPSPGPGVCEICWNLTDGYRRCYACEHLERALAMATPISYSVAHEQLHHTLAGYKRWPGPLRSTAQRHVAAILWRHLARHEGCLAAATGVASFDLVTTVPAGNVDRDRDQPLRRIVGEVVEPTRARFRRLLVRSPQPTEPRRFDPERFAPTGSLAGEAVLLIDDTWTSGASAQSAGAVLRAAGAGPVSALVIGRHVNRDWGRNDVHLRALPQAFDWERCVHCAGEARVSRPTSRDARTPSSPRSAAG